MKALKNGIVTLVASFAMAAAMILVAPAKADAQVFDQQQLMKKVRHELVTLPYYGIWDNLAYKVEGSTVTLYGQVVRPTTRSDAARRVAKIKGVEQVINKIEVLPLSSYDDRLRARTFRAISNTAGLYRYLMGANPSLHIIVNRGRITLEGVVSNRGDSQLAYMAARGVSGAFNVTNNLRVEGEEVAPY